MTSLVNSTTTTWAIGAGAGTFSLTFDAGATSNRVLHVYIAETAGAGTPTLTYNSVALTHLTNALWELIAPASGTNTLSITYGANASTHAAFVWAVDDVNQDSPWLVGFSRATRSGSAVPTTTSPFVASSDQTCITLEISASTDTVSASDGSLTTSSLVYGASKLWAGTRQGAGAVFDPRWSINSVLTAAQFAIIYRPAGSPLTAGWYALTSNIAQENGASNYNVGGDNIEAVQSAVAFSKVTSNNGTTVAAIDATGTLYTWGSDNGYGMLGDGSVHAYQAFFLTTPTAVSGVTTAVDCAVGQGTTFYVKNDGTVWYFGRDITTVATNQTSATQVSGLSNIVRVAAADFNLLALDNSGALWFVGDNSQGQAGNGSHSGIVSTPFNVLSSVADFAMSEYHAAACTTGGTVYCWGANTSKATGQGTSAGFTTTPSTVSGPSNVIQIAALDEPCTLALTNTNQVWHWGGNSFGEAGDGTEGVTLYTPHQVTMPGGETYTTLAPNFRSFECYVLTASKKVYGWGLNAFGAIARNGFADVLSPTQLYASLLSGVTAICNAGDDGIIFRIGSRGRAWCCVVGL